MGQFELETLWQQCRVSEVSGARKYVAWRGVSKYVANEGRLAVFKIAESLKDWTRMGPFYLVFILKK